jgi:hypothetical protein
MSPRFKQTALLLASIFVIAACSSSSATPSNGPSCLATPTLCPAGQTCWPTSSSDFACVPSASGVVAGTSCVESVAVATCGDGMLCDATNPDGEGQCAAYCEASDSCPSGYTCQATTVSGGSATISICRVPPPTTTTTPDGGPLPTADGGQTPPDAAITIPDDASTDAGPIKQ